MNLQGLRSGHGVLIFKNGDEYAGSFSNGLRSGVGTVKYTDGNVFVGMFEADRREGQGKLIAPGKKVLFSGNWTNDKPDT